MADEPDYEVGYKRPPKHTQYKPGESGNRRGRTPEAKNLATLLRDALNETITVNDQGRRRRISKRKAIVSQLVNRSAQSDLKAITILLGLMHALEQRTGAPDEPAPLTDADRQVLEYIRKHRGRSPEGGSDGGC
jgi:hypothetical protein